jgi:U3 small nucleolar RNA-associated protein 4
MAIGRSNGDIEIWNPANGSWHQETIIRGGKDRSIDGLVWVNEPDHDLGDGRFVLGKSRLFSIGYTSTITEWDLVTGKPRRHASGQHGDIWCVATQRLGDATAKPNASGAVQELNMQNKLVCGTIDGELVMYSTEDDDLQFQRVVVRSPTKKAQMVSITFQSRKIAIVGCSDSTVRAYDIIKGHMLRRMTLGSDLVSGSKEIIVWSVQCLPNGNIVSGDSTGQLCIWDGKTYTQMQRIQSHKQDILSLSVSADGSTILSGGMDRRTILYKQNAGAGQRWGKVWGRRYHSHDVKAMTTYESGRISVVVSGGECLGVVDSLFCVGSVLTGKLGPDANMAIVPLKEMTREYHRIISNLPQQPPITSAQKARFIVSWWEREVHIWVLRKPAAELVKPGEGHFDLNQNRKLLRTIVIKGDFNISCATINPEGTLLVVSTATDVKAFRLEHQDPVKPSDVNITTVDVPQRLSKLGASKVQLSPDSSWLCLVQDGLRVLVANIDRSDDGGSFFIPENKIRKVFRLSRHTARHIQNGGLGKYDRSITHITFSRDSKMLATADMAGYVDTWVLRGQKDKKNGAEEAGSSSEGDSSESEESVAGDAESWVRNPNGKLLPKLPSAPTVLSFSDDVPASRSNDYTLLGMTSSWNMHVFHPLQGSLTPWSRRHPRKALPAPVLDLIDPPKGVFWQGSRVWIYGISFLVMFDLSQDLPQPAPGTGQVGLKRKRTGKNTGAGGKMALGNLAPQRVTKHLGNKEVDVDMDDVQPDDESNSDDDMGGTAGEELTQRNGGHASSSAGMDLAETTTGTQRSAWWMTLKYRPILGVVPLDEGEIALVERPIWDMEMPERYFAGEEWER